MKLFQKSSDLKQSTKPRNLTLGQMWDLYRLGITGSTELDVLDFMANSSPSDIRKMVSMVLTNFDKVDTKDLPIRCAGNLTACGYSEFLGIIRNLNNGK